jgi:hypothetical protein
MSSIGCSSTKQASYTDRRGLMLLETGEIQRNKNHIFKQSDTVKRIQKVNKKHYQRYMRNKRQNRYHAN